MGKNVLGKGFGSLLPENYDSSVLLDKGDRVQKVLIQDIRPDPNQPRKSFDAIALNELTESIKRYGILQPIVITNSGEGKYVIIAGERRYRAAKNAGLTHIPSLVRTLEELERLEIGLIENVQRVDLTPLEQALSIARLNEQFNMSYQDIGKRLGKAHTTIVNTARLLQLPEHARLALQNGKISEGHARAVLALKGDEQAQKFLVAKIINDGWSVRQAEKFVHSSKEKSPTKESQPSNTRAFTKDINKIQAKLGSNVKVVQKNKGIQVQLSFKTNKEYTRFLDSL